MPPRTPSDDAWLAVKDNVQRTRQRRPTEGLPEKWRQAPLTIGLMIALGTGAVFVANATRSYSEDVRTQIAAAIEQHNKDATCHMYRNADHNAAIAHIHSQLKEIKQKLERLTDKQPSSRRRR